MTDQQETSRDQNNYEEENFRSTAEHYTQPVSKEKSPESLRVFVIGKHIEMLRNEIIRDRNAQ